jgi:hypothetical protein
MRQGLYAVLMAFGLSFLGLSAASAGGALPTPAPDRSLVETVEYDNGGGNYCRNLRYRCENKEELGEEGAGNCRRYREECGWQRRSYCENLRYRCENKENLEEEGNGNCRRYRRECTDH